jgi:hypothetical protein
VIQKEKEKDKEIDRQRGKQIDREEEDNEEDSAAYCMRINYLTMRGGKEGGRGGGDYDHLLGNLGC